MSKNVPASIRQRLLNFARKTNQEFNRVLQRFAIERFIYRLTRTESADALMLKGAMLLLQLDGVAHRHTRDADFMMFGDSSEDRVRALVANASEIDCPEDGARFDSASIRILEIREANTYEGYRVMIDGTLGKIDLFVQLDIAFGDAVTPEPERAPISCLLDLPEPVIQQCPLTTVIAEKTEIMVKRGEANSRLKDYFDLEQISNCELDGSLLVKSIRATFERRGTAIPAGVPVGLSGDFGSMRERQQQWAAFLRRIEQEDRPLPPVLENLRVFLVPAFHAARLDEDFNVRWIPQHGWQSA